MRAALIVLAGVAAFGAAALYFAPATLVVNWVSAPARLWEVQGRLMDGSAQFSYDEHDLGRLAWQFDAAALTDGALGVRWRLTEPSFTVAGTAQADFADVAVTAAGRLDEAALDRLLLPYRIDVAGNIAIERLNLLFDHNLRPIHVSGRLKWPGGPVRYRLANLGHLSATLPPMVAELELKDDELHLIAKAADDATPLILSRLDPEGWVHTGITRRFTELAALPWPGTGPDEAVVLEVSEQLL